MERLMKLPERKDGGTMTQNGALPSLSANKQFSTRSCVRCEGLFVSEWSYDLQNSGTNHAETLRCVQCGNRIDPVILQNQARLVGERQSKWQIQQANSTRILILGNAA